MDTGIFSDPKRVGPGVWFVLHTASARACLDPDYLPVLRALLSLVGSSFRCSKCRGHFENHLQTHPLDAYRGFRDSLGREVGYFKCTYDAHDAVNRRRGLPSPSLETAFDYYLNGSGDVCTSCGGDGAVTRSTIPSLYPTDISFPPERRRLFRLVGMHK